VAINLKCARGIEICLRMERVDIVIENFRSGTKQPSSV
jgi:crotonobetainyl-CoA:carnitine CoA-transferase CaiB-like acyl-CoA transferase